MRASGLAMTMAALLATGAAAQAPATPAAPQFSADRVKAHVSFLADDLLEGRDAGSRGYEIAARYVASQFAALGLRPAGADGFFQPVPFVSATLAEAPARVTVGGRAFLNGTGVLVRPDAREARQAVEASAVFAGYGLDASQAGFDDYRGLDVRGKWVAVLAGYPKGTPSEVGAHLNAEKARAAEKRGAIGVITLLTRAELARRPWVRRTEAMREPALSWVGADGRPFSLAPGVRGAATFDVTAGDALFAGASRSFAQVLDEADKAGAKPRGFALRAPVRL